MGKGDHPSSAVSTADRPDCQRGRICPPPWFVSTCPRTRTTLRSTVSCHVPATGRSYCADLEREREDSLRLMRLSDGQANMLARRPASQVEHPEHHLLRKLTVRWLRTAVEPGTRALHGRWTRSRVDGGQSILWLSPPFLLLCKFQSLRRPFSTDGPQRQAEVGRRFSSFRVSSLCPVTSVSHYRVLQVGFSFPPLPPSASPCRSNPGRPEYYILCREKGERRRESRRASSCLCWSQTVALPSRPGQ